MAEKTGEIPPYTKEELGKMNQAWEQAAHQTLRDPNATPKEQTIAANRIINATTNLGKQDR